MKPCLYAIMPLSADSAFQQKRNIFVCIAKQYDINVHFPFEVSSSNNEDVLDDLRCASVVFADLSYERPSCYYELGLAQALGLPTYLIACEGTAIHQIEGQVRFYKDLVGYEKLVRDALNEVMSNIRFQ